MRIISMLAFSRYCFALVSSIDRLVQTLCAPLQRKYAEYSKAYFPCVIQITNKTVDKKSSHNPYMQDYARFFVQFLIGY